ncbi:hypothetical protein MRX96_012035 [Rhipicephalus microplus]
MVRRCSASRRLAQPRRVHLADTARDKVQTTDRDCIKPNQRSVYANKSVPIPSRQARPPLSLRRRLPPLLPENDYEVVLRPNGAINLTAVKPANVVETICIAASINDRLALEEDQVGVGCTKKFLGQPILLPVLVVNSSGTLCVNRTLNPELCKLKMPLDVIKAHSQNLGGFIDKPLEYPGTALLACCKCVRSTVLQRPPLHVSPTLAGTSDLPTHTGDCDSSVPQRFSMTSEIALPPFLQTPGTSSVPWAKWCHVFQAYVDVATGDITWRVLKKSLLLNALGVWP